MSNYQTVTDLIEQLTGSKYWSTQIFITITGDPMLGLFLDRVLWWSDKSSRDDGFFWKDTDDWYKELRFSYAQVTRVRKELETFGFISTKIAKANGAPTVHFRANIDFIIEQIHKHFSIIEKVENRNSEELILDNLNNSNSTNSKIENRNSLKSITGITTGKTNREETQPGPLSLALAKICKLNWSFVQKSRELKRSFSETLSILVEVKAEPDSLNEFLEWRKKHHWSGKDNIAPTLKQVGELWGQYEDWVKQGRPAPIEVQKSSYQNGASPPPKPNARLTATERAAWERQRQADESEVYNPLA